MGAPPPHYHSTPPPEHHHHHHHRCHHHHLSTPQVGARVHLQGGGVRAEGPALHLPAGQLLLSRVMAPVNLVAMVSLVTHSSPLWP